MKCECGCGGEARRQFVHGHNQRGAGNHRWKGGTFTEAGYVYLWRPQHPQADKMGYVHRARIIAEGKCGRLLMPDEVAHHLNGIKNDDAPANIVVMTRSEHQTLHASDPLRRRAKGESSGRATLTEIDVMKIRAMRNNGATYREIGSTFGIHRHSVGRITRRISWAHLK
jgi:hypothetical protein